MLVYHCQKFLTKLEGWRSSWISVRSGGLLPAVGSKARLWVQTNIIVDKYPQSYLQNDLNAIYFFYQTACEAHLAAAALLDSLSAREVCFIKLR